MKKKIGAVLLAGALTCTVGFSLAGCGGEVQQEFEMPDSGFDVTQPVEITFYHTMGAKLKGILDKMIPEFNKLYPNITVTNRSPGGWDEIKTQIVTELGDNSNPDVAYCYPDHVAEYIQWQAAQTLDDFLPGGRYENYTVKQVKLDEKGNQVKDGDNYVYEEVPLGLTQEQKDSFIDAFYNEGNKFEDGSKTYTLPWSKSTEVIFYNADFLEQHSLEVPETWDELEDFCEAVKKIDDSLIPFTYDSEANWFITMCEQYGSGYTSSTGEKFLFDNPTNRAFVQRFAEWRQKGYFMTQILNSNAYTSELFTSEKSIMCIGSTGGTGYQMDTSGETAPFKVGIAPIPQLKPYSSDHKGYDENYHAKVISQGPSVCIFRNNDPQKVLASWLFVKFFTTNVEFQARFSAESGYMPVLKPEVMRTNAIYDEFLNDTEASSALKALAVDVGMKHSTDYFVSPAFFGSSTAREQVGQLMAAVFERPDTLDAEFKKAMEKCEYYS